MTRPLRSEPGIRIAEGAWPGADADDDDAPKSAATPEPIVRDCRIPALDGLPLGATVFEPSGPRSARDRKAIFMASATGVKRERYRPFALHLARQGWSVVTFDYRGIGDSRGGDLRTLDHTMFEWGSKDVAGVIDWIEKTWAPSRLAAVAHSIGGQVLPFAPNSGRVDALLMIGSQKGYWKIWGGFNAYICRGFFRSIPILVKLLGYYPLSFAGCEDLPPRAAVEWGRWGLYHDFVDEDGRSLNFHHARFRAPILALSFSDDPYAPPAAVEKLLEFYASSEREHRHFQPADLGVTEFGHSGFFTNPARAPLWEQALEWLGRVTA